MVAVASSSVPVPPPDLPLEYRRVDTREILTKFQKSHDCLYPDDPFTCSDIDAEEYTIVQRGLCAQCRPWWNERTFHAVPKGAGSAAEFCPERAGNKTVHGRSMFVWSTLTVYYRDEQCQEVVPMQEYSSTRDHLTALVPACQLDTPEYPRPPSFLDPHRGPIVRKCSPMQPEIPGFCLNNGSPEGRACPKHSDNKTACDADPLCSFLMGHEVVPGTYGHSVEEPNLLV